LKVKKTDFTRKVVTIIIAIVIFPCILFSVGDGKNFPNWDDVYRLFDIAPSLEENDFIRFIDVEQGDGILIVSQGKTALIDTGPESSAQELVKNLHSYGVIQIDLLIFTHFDLDHVGGAKKIVDNFPVGNLIMPNIIDQPEGADHAVYAASTISENKGNVYTAMQGMAVNIGNFEITILAYFPDMEEENDRSVILMAKNGDFKFLLMGDAEAKAEKRLLSENLNLDCDVLKVGHHGSSTSTTPELVDACSPETAVISCGFDNYYLHPHDETIGTLEKRHIEFYRTDMYGDVTCFVEKEKLKFKFEIKEKRPSF